ncbi:hypothetical protein IGI04_028256 [Brassica rapa subsp. trilocularis]|uniref:Non-specific serine/threonine protein kinase n=1 Tax=Brassica rapa subsp. trilocularis TaxID=1813537 RepID=A0ABQ7L4D4_BRACM|nr:hypothetical protein IGI04_028256 [Brassica rapa subsp. trilocularis]
MLCINFLITQDNVIESNREREKKMRSHVPNYHHPYTFFFVFILFPASGVYANTLSPTESLTISNNKTIVSRNETFELGFFTPGSSSRWYLGIWYKKIPTRTYVWVANRDNPLSRPSGSLKISSDNNLVIYDHSDTPVWSTNLTVGASRSPVVAELLDNGNFVLNSNDPEGYLWQSFDFPTDTLLPDMKLGWDKKTGLDRVLRSWKSVEDPASGDYSTKLETRGFPEYYVFNKETIIYRSGPWIGNRFSCVPEMKPIEYMVYTFIASNEEVSYAYHMTKPDVYSTLSLNYTGTIQRRNWIEQAQDWKQLWYQPKDICDNYRKCGNYGYCDSNNLPNCNCIKGFGLENGQEWALRDDSAGCVRKTRLSCDGRDGFVVVKRMKLPDTAATVLDRGIGLKECKAKCLQDCNCTAYANTDIRDGGSGCVIWNGGLFDIRMYPNGGQDIYVKLAAADLDHVKITSHGTIIGSGIGLAILLLLSIIIFGYWKRKQKRFITIQTPIVDQVRSQDLLINQVVLTSERYISRENKTDDLELPLMEFEALDMATNRFSVANMLGQGGFGIVYKGMLPDGKEIAVKRLSKMSLQGTDEFKNEVRLIARLQHINLVRLLGCCVDKGEKMLIYEYLENLSLDSHLFDKIRRSNLSWPKRFDITNGIARGLLYLHQDSRFRIIHRDLKASNVLLDKNMTPKISDFGMARIFGRDETEANTRKVVGTYGYMAPEYAMDGIFSMKSDVFSFGVLLLEIITGKRSKGFYNSNRDNNLLGFVWRYWKEGKGIEIIDPIIIDSSSSALRTVHEILRCIQIGLLCVQERAEDRPVMSTVMVMLGSETTAIPQPKPPGFCVGRSLFETQSSSSTQRDDELSVNQITLSVIDARTMSATESLTISSSKTIISRSEIFELGFFTPASSSRWYLGIWYKKIPTRTYVWVANRDTPLSHSNGSLKISDNNLVILDHSNKPVWSTNLTGGTVRSPVVAELLDNGNFVLRHSNNYEYLWQSFDFPTDTLLPEMKLGWDLKTGMNRFLRSRKTPDDPSSGDYSTKFKTIGFPEVYVCNKESIVYRSGPWDGIRFNGIPEVRPVDYLVLNFSATDKEITYSYHITKSNIYSIVTLTPTGLLQRSTWVERLQNWRPLWYSPRDICNNYKQCGSYGYCDSNASPVCNCIHGFKPRNKWDLRDDFDGCVRKTRLSCDGTDGFVRLKNMKLPDTTKTIVDRGIGTEECEARCLKNCNCTAFANADIRNGGWGCVIWTGDMLDMRYFAEGGQDLYVRQAAADLDDKITNNGKIIGSSVGMSILFLLSIIIFRFWKTKQKRATAVQTPIVDQVRSKDSLTDEVIVTRKSYISRESKTEDLELPLMEFEAVAIATNNFSDGNKLGKGGFGIVYKGMLPDGKEIAVKRLSKKSLQGTGEFKNEVRLIARLQHLNLVRLLGCCVDKGEKMLIYDGYMSPEYAMDGIFSMKSDVFSFGVLLLEIISGKKTNGFYNSNRDLNLLGFVWRYWKEGKGIEIVDPIIIDDSSSAVLRTHEILRCIQIGLLCVQERAEDRPVMSTVMVMLGSETTAIPQPKPPGFCVGRSLLETESSSSTQRGDEVSVNQITLSVIDAR